MIKYKAVPSGLELGCRIKDCLERKVDPYPVQQAVQPAS